MFAKAVDQVTVYSALNKVITCDRNEAHPTTNLFTTQMTRMPSFVPMQVSKRRSLHYFALLKDSCGVMVCVKYVN